MWSSNINIYVALAVAFLECAVSISLQLWFHGGYFSGISALHAPYNCGFIVEYFAECLLFIPIY